MQDVALAHWFAIFGLGAAWHGLQILIVGGWPHSLRARQVAAADTDPALAFQRFWIEQYRLIGLTLTGLGLALAGWGFST